MIDGKSHARLYALARLLVESGDMTHAGERMLQGVADADVFDQDVDPDRICDCPRGGHPA